MDSGPYVAKLPYELNKSDIASINFDQLIWPLGKPHWSGTVADLSDNDHLIVNPTSKRIFSAVPKVCCKVSLLLTEPKAIHGRYIWMLWLMQKHFYRIFHRDRQLEEKYDNVVAMHLADTWVDPAISVTVEQKHKLVSLVASGKRDLPGHQLRHRLVESLPNIDIPVSVMGHGYQPFEHKADSHVPYYFSVVIENAMEHDYFTEKLIDCLLCECVPIYWGCQEIGEYYDTKGMIICNSLGALTAALVNLTEEDYWQRLDVIKANKQKAQANCNPEVAMANYLLNHNKYISPI